MPDKIAEFQRLLDRREFTTATLMALLSGVAVTVVGCDSESPTAPNEGDVAGNVTANHGHTAVITDAQLDAGNAVTLDIRGGADHAHSVVLTMPEIGQIAAGQQISKTSSTNGSPTFGTHSHTVIFN
jgi:hypothetical protein